MLRHPRRVWGFQKAGFTKRIRMGGEIRGVELFGKSSAEILCSLNEHVFLICRSYYVNVETGHSQWLTPSGSGSLDLSPLAGRPPVLMEPIPPL
jgi:hypothetical protein